MKYLIVGLGNIGYEYEGTRHNIGFTVLDAFAKARTVKQAKNIMIDAIKNDFVNRFNDPEGKNMHLEMAYTHDLEAAEAFKKEVEEVFPGMEIILNPLSLSVSCHIGPGALALACSKKIPELDA